MKKMNKLTAAVLAAAMLGSMAMPVFAADDNDYNAATDTTSAEKTRSTTVVYAVTASYEWTIHSEVDLGTTSTSKNDLEVKVTKNVIPEGKVLKITVAGQGTNGAFEIKNQVPDGGGTKDGKITRTYTVKSDEGESGKTSNKTNVEAKGTVMVVPSATNEKTAKLDFELVDNTATVTATAGSYKGTVTYTADITDAE